jgi:hypothetical protein
VKKSILNGKNNLAGEGSPDNKMPQLGMPHKVDAALNDAQRALSESEASLAKLAMEISSFADCPECSDQAIQAMAII